MDFSPNAPKISDSALADYKTKLRKFVTNSRKKFCATSAFKKAIILRKSIIEMVTLEQALDIVMQLPLQQREMLIDIIHKRHIESRREEIARDAREAISAFHAGKLKAQPVGEIISELRQSIAT